MPIERSENWVDTSWFEKCLTACISLPSHWIFIRDAACIFPDFDTLRLFDRVYEVVFFEDALLARRKLEPFKDNREGLPACIVSRQSPEVERHLLDYIVRSQCVEITPQSILEFAQPGYSWTREVNHLSGPDFWEIFERLQAYRPNYPRFMTPAEAIDLILSARLDIDLRANLSAREAIDIRQRMEDEASLVAWGEKYPKWFQVLNLQVRAALPLMEKLEGDADFVYFLWTSYALAQHNQHYVLFLPRIFGETIWKKYGNTPPDEIWHACHQLIRNVPNRVIDQIKRTEIWLTQERGRLELFQTWVGVDASNLSRTVQYAKKESLFCVPMREALRLLAAQLCRAPESLDAVELQEILHNIQRKHLFLGDDTTYLRIKDTFRAFASLVELNQLIGSVESRDWLDKRHRTVGSDQNGEVWRKEAYPVYLSKLNLQADGLEQLNFQCNLLSATVLAQVLDRVNRLMDGYNREFAQWVATSYVAWTSRKRDEPLLTVDFLDLLFLPRYRKYIAGSPNPAPLPHLTPRPPSLEGRGGQGHPSRSAYIFIFDGMRWDAWEAIKSKALQAFQGKFALEGVFPLLSILPTTTIYNKQAIFTGRLPADYLDSNWWEALPTAFQRRGIDGVQWVSDRGNNQTQLLDLIEADEVPVKIFNLTFMDEKLHHATQNLSMIYEEIKLNFELAVQPYLERIPNDSLIFVLSDHGFIEASEHRRMSADAFQTSRISAVHPRYVGLSSFSEQANLAHLIVLSASDIGLKPESDTLQYGFATSRTQILPAAQPQLRNGFSPRQPVRYAHGGISMQEMIVPCAVFVPTVQGQLDFGFRIG